MTTGILFENADEVDQYLHYRLIAETWANITSYQNLTISQKVRLKNAGYSEAAITGFIPMINRAIKWALKASPTRVLVSAHEMVQWEDLLNITNIITQ